MMRRTTPAGPKAAATTEFGLPLRNWDVKVTLDGGAVEVLKVQARCALSAVRTASYTAEWDWSAEKRASVIRIRAVRV